VPRLTPDGRFVAFQSNAGNLVENDDNGVTDAFVLDRDTGELARVSGSATGASGNGRSVSPSLTPDGWFVAFSAPHDSTASGNSSPVLRSR
jgi:Tol biopolymer transport system component